MKKFLISDLDGTLLDDWHNIDEKNLEYINILKEREHGFAIATGRNVEGVKFLKDRYKLECDFFILLNGALIMDNKFNIIRKKVISSTILKELVNIAKKSELKLFFSDGDKYMYLEELGTVEFCDIKFSPYKSLDHILNNKTPIISASFMGNKNNIKELNTLVNKLNSFEEIDAFRNQHFIDIAAKGVSKGEGINYIQKNMEIKSDNIYVIGDSWNDVSMLSAYKNSYTFNHTEDKLKKHATNLVNRVSDCIKDMIKI
ncbi:Cof-type HAD-IIB family hydrolase [Clostridium frigidicarnis]|uniref:Cof subfamily of IIB subfamily of haloacid dehalogenase superfamily/HAD-superfamily hydrolase, subfamily IIB n=1 Tax=Clostridium frigidicarnis TaxID=84698 RepID=A0A1I1BEM5_9CLOT|nr:Cof-type HAD-IIB family hydrolase [Clostridium frigidicarnis]SFB48066.1 hypothetical protein SAMN04488528_11002 [Clostridium frigidicarnis]